MLTLAKSMSDSDLKVLRISAVSLAMAEGLVRRRKVTPERRVAVVSDPPMMRIAEFAWSFSRVRPFPRCQQRLAISSEFGRGREGVPIHQPA